MIIEYKGKKPKISPSAFIAPTAVIIGDVTVGDEASIWWGAVLRSDQNQQSDRHRRAHQHPGQLRAAFGRSADDHRRRLHHRPRRDHGRPADQTRRDYRHERHTLLENVEIGEEALIAAGSVVVPHTKIPPRVLAAGAPAKVKKEISRRSSTLDQDGLVDVCQSLPKLPGRRLQNHWMSPWRNQKQEKQPCASFSSDKRHSRKKLWRNFVSKGEEVVAVYCPPDAPGGKLDPVKQKALQLGIPVRQHKTFKAPEVREEFVSLNADLAILAFVSQIVPPQVFSVPRLGSICFHPSLLPKYRGASAINWALIKGETVDRPDSFLGRSRASIPGPILLQKEVKVEPDDTTGSLYFNKIFPLGIEAIGEAVDLIKAGNPPRIVAR